MKFKLQDFFPKKVIFYNIFSKNYEKFSQFNLSSKIVNFLPYLSNFVANFGQKRVSQQNVKGFPSTKLVLISS